MEDRKFYVYQLRVEDEIMPFYVGKGYGKRRYEHTKPCTLDTNTHKVNKIKKALRLGKKVKSELIESSLTEDDAFILEKFYIAAYGRCKFGGCLTNATDGGEGTSGHTHSEESKRGMSLAQTGKRLSEEHKKKISEGGMGRVCSESTRLKRSLARIGVPNPLYVGTSNPKAKLTEHEIIHSYICYLEGMKISKIAKIFDLTTPSMSKIVYGATWKHLFSKYMENTWQQ